MKINGSGESGKTNPIQTQSKPISVPLAPFIVYNFRKVKIDKEFCV
jgi:hypothetical protein